ncbi:UNVERIFIED_CONTAM: Cytosolic sulfotransferase 15 [Sesamum radiatum]|uniref:Sulfotransferase n=1 Tax=Sesamum radiatum TaxID=300843 RepID=A0AAW2IT81_SESRA
MQRPTGQKNDCEELLQTLPDRKTGTAACCCQYQHSWFPVKYFRRILSAKNNFKAHETDIILATMPKAGTTWLKALIFSIVNRHLYNSSLNESPLLSSNSHDLVPFLELDIYRVDENPGPGIHSFSKNLGNPRWNLKRSRLSVDEACEMYCNGVHPFGPFWDHVLGFWNASLEKPDTILFLKYEELKEDIGLSLKKMAEFMGVPFSADEVRLGGG